MNAEKDIKTAIAVNPHVAGLHAYVPGEQPKNPDIIKLNTNEAPYPPAPQVTGAVREAAGQPLNKYPDPASRALREAIAARLQVDVEETLAGNGSDEVLRLICHAFLSPGDADEIAITDPTYSLYPILAAMFGAATEEHPLSGPDYSLPESLFETDAKIIFVPNPNPPLGILHSAEELHKLAAAHPNRLLVIDEAYTDFADANALDVFRQHENVVITRTFSKSYSLAGMRVGFAIARRGIIQELEKVKDSYNISRISQAAALAAWNAQDYYGEMTQRIRGDREFLAAQLRKRGFDVPPSQGNFVFARRQGAADLYAALKQREILVRYFNTPPLRDGVRITIGTRKELEALLSGIDEISESRK